MFERYTEKARRVIFFARYEASQFGSTYIETEHLLLGLLREDTPMVGRFMPGPGALLDIVRRRLASTKPCEKISTSVDMPLSNESKRVLGYAAEEADRLKQHFIGTEHLLLGLLREKSGMAAEILAPMHIDLQAIRLGIVKPGTYASEEHQYRTHNPAYFGKYRGIVLNNIDPFQLGRLLVGVPAISGPELGWAMPCTPYPVGGTPTLAVPPAGTPFG